MAKITKRTMIKRLRKRIKDIGSQTDAAAEFGVSTSYLQYVLQNGKDSTKGREPGQKILDALGLRPAEQMYEEVKDA